MIHLLSIELTSLPQRLIAAIQDDLRRDLAAVDEEYQERSEHARALAKMPYRSDLEL